MRVDLELEVELELISVDDDGHLHAVADPLRAWEESAKGAAHRELVGALAPALLRVTCAMGIEDVREGRSAEGHAQISLHVLAEVDECAAPSLVGREHRLHLSQLRLCRLVDGCGRGLCFEDCRR